MFHHERIHRIGVANRPWVCEHCVDNIGVGCGELRDCSSKAFDSDGVKWRTASVNRGVQNLLTRVFLDDLLDQLLQRVVGIQVSVGVKSGCHASRQEGRVLARTVERQSRLGLTLGLRLCTGRRIAGPSHWALKSVWAQAGTGKNCLD